MLVDVSTKSGASLKLCICAVIRRSSRSSSAIRRVCSNSRDSASAFGRESASMHQTCVHAHTHTNTMRCNTAVICLYRTHTARLQTLTRTHAVSHLDLSNEAVVSARANVPPPGGPDPTLF
jgi:hypothetical protein